MQIEISDIVRQHMKDIWHYTDQNWGEKQANKYLDELNEVIEGIADFPGLWSKMNEPELKEVFYTRYQHHYIFFRKLSNKRIGILAILHEKMDLPRRILDTHDS